MAEPLGNVPQLPKQMPRAASGAAHGTAAGGHSHGMLAATVRRLEQRLESERRNTQRQVQRIERRLEESLKEPCTGGRWAELEGYVDGLAETVQELMRRAEDTGQGSSLQTPRLSEEAATFCNQGTEATAPNLQGARIVAAAVDRSQQRQCERLRQIEQLFEEYNDRLARTELQLTVAQGQDAATVLSTGSLNTQLADLTARMGALEVHQARLDTSAVHTKTFQEPPSSSPARALLGHTDPILLASGSSPSASPVKSVGASFSSPARLLQTPNETHNFSALQVLTARVDRVVEIVGELDARVLEGAQGGAGSVAELDAWTAELGARLSRLEQLQESKGDLERDIALMCEQISALQAQLGDGRSLRKNSAAIAENVAPTMDSTSRKQVMRQLNFTCERVAELGERVQEMEREMGSNVDASEMQAQLDHVFERTTTQPVWSNGEDSEESLCDENLSEKDDAGSGVRCEHWKEEHGAISFVVHNPPEKSDSVHKADGFMAWLSALWDPQRDPQEYANLQDIRNLCRRVTRLAPRIQAAEHALEELSAGSNLQAEPLEDEGCSDSQAFSFKGCRSCIADSINASPSTLEQTGDPVHEQVAELTARVQDVEGNLQDMTELQEMRQQISRVGEQVLRLVVRLQNVENSAEAAADRREIRTDVGDLSDQIAGVELRVQDAEHGLERMAEGFGRVCEELAGLRARSNVVQQPKCDKLVEGSGTAGANEAENLVTSQESPPTLLETIKQLHERLQALETENSLKSSQRRLQECDTSQRLDERLQELETKDNLAGLQERLQELDIIRQIDERLQEQELATGMSEHYAALKSSTGDLHEKMKDHDELLGKLLEHSTRMTMLEKDTSMEDSESKELLSKLSEHSLRMTALEESLTHLHEKSEKIDKHNIEVLPSRLLEHAARMAVLEDRFTLLHERHVSQELPSKMLEHSTRMTSLEESLALLHDKALESETKERMICLEEQVAQLQSQAAPISNLVEQIGGLQKQNAASSVTVLQEHVAGIIERLEEAEKGLNLVHETALESEIKESVNSLQEQVARMEIKDPMDDISRHTSHINNLQEHVRALQEQNVGGSVIELHERVKEITEKLEGVDISRHSDHIDKLLEQVGDLQEQNTACGVAELQERVAEITARLEEADISGHTAHINSLLEEVGGLKEQSAACSIQEVQKEVKEMTARLAEAEESIVEVLDLEDLRQQWVQGMEESQAAIRDQLSEMKEQVQAVEHTAARAVEQVQAAENSAPRALEQVPGCRSHPSSEALTGQLARTCLGVAACHKEVKLAIAGEVPSDRSMPVDASSLEMYTSAEDPASPGDASQELESHVNRLCESVNAFHSGVQSALQSQEKIVNGPRLRDQLAIFNDRLQQLEERILFEPPVFGDENLGREAQPVPNGELSGVEEGQQEGEVLAERDPVKLEAQVLSGRQTVDDLLMPRSAPLSARGAGIETALARSEGRLLSASLRLEAQVRSLTATGHDAGAGPPPESTQVDIDRLAKDLEQATLAAARRANLESHRQEALEAVESRVTVVSDRITDICSRLDEAERGLELSERSGAALARRFERLESVVDTQVGVLAADVASIQQRAVIDRTLQMAAVSHQQVTHHSMRSMTNSAGASL